MELPPIDLLIGVALEDEFDAMLAGGAGAGGWWQVRDHVHVCALPNDAGKQFVDLDHASSV